MAVIQVRNELGVNGGNTLQSHGCAIQHGRPLAALGLMVLLQAQLEGRQEAYDFFFANLGNAGEVIIRRAVGVSCLNQIPASEEHSAALRTPEIFSAAKRH